MSTPGGKSNTTRPCDPTRPASTSRMCSGSDVGRVRGARGSHSPLITKARAPAQEYSSSGECAFTRNGAPRRRRRARPISTWFVNTSSAGQATRRARRFASTYARRSVPVKSWREIRARSLYRSMTKTRAEAARQVRRQGLRAPRSLQLGARSCETRQRRSRALHYARARGVKFDPVPPRR